MLALVVNAFVWGMSWWPFRQLQDEGVHPLWSTALIYLVAFLGFVLVRPGALPELLRTPGLWLLAAAAGMTNVGFNWAVTIGDVVRVVLLFYLMPAWSVLLAWPMLGEQPSRAGLARLVLALAGVAIVLDTSGVGLPWPRTLAEWLALMGGFSFALTNILLRRLHRTPPATRVIAMFLGGTLAASAVGTLAMGQGLVPAPVALPAGALAIAGLLGLAFLLGNSALQFGAARLAAQTTALVMLSEVLFASVSAVLAGAAQLSERTWLGGALVVAAAAWSAWAAPGEDRAAAAQSAA